MIYHNKSDEQRKYGGLLPNDKAFCFYCHKELLWPRIEWRGCDAEDKKGSMSIFIHAECARSLCIRILRDVWEWECKTEHDLYKEKK